LNLRAARAANAVALAFVLLSLVARLCGSRRDSVR